MIDVEALTVRIDLGAIGREGEHVVVLVREGGPDGHARPAPIDRPDNKLAAVLRLRLGLGDDEGAIGRELRVDLGLGLRSDLQAMIGPGHQVTQVGIAIADPRCVGSP